MRSETSSRALLTLGLLGAAMVFALRCGAPVIRCHSDDNCLEEQVCDTRQGLCVDEEGGQPRNGDESEADAGETTDAGEDGGMIIDPTDAGMDPDGGM